MLSTATGSSSRLTRALPRSLAVIGFLGLSGVTARAAADGVPLTSPSQAWMLPMEAKLADHPLRMEGRVTYYDPMWRLFWFEQNGVSSYMPLGDHAPTMHAGQHVLVEGRLTPNLGLSADSVKVTVLQDYEPTTALDTAGRFSDVDAFNNHIVTVDALVDTQMLIDNDHLRLALIVDDRPVVGWVKPDDPHNIPKWEGKYVHFEALYASRFDPTLTDATVELWAGPQSGVKVTRTLDDHPGFALPATPIDRIYQAAIGTVVLVRGHVQADEANTGTVIRDDTGELTIHSLQVRHPPFGSEVEVTGRVEREGRKWVLRSALHRKSAASASSPTGVAELGDVLTRVDRIRELTPEEAAGGQRVRISGTVTWAMPGTKFFFLQDVSGGIRVRCDSAIMATPARGKFLEVEGITFDAGFVPGMEVKHVKDLGSMNPPHAKLVTYDQAISGKENGQWVQMRGFLQRIESDGDWRRIHVTTPTGDFIALLESPVNFEANAGSLITVNAVCDTIADDRGRLKGVTLRVPFLENITTDEEAAIDPYDLPLRSIKSLRQFSGLQGMNRVRVTGTVVHGVPGRSLDIEQAGSALLLLTGQTGTVTPGTRIEAVGVLGWEGARLVLRETIFQQISTGPPPVPVELTDPTKLVPALDCRLVTTRGTLIDVSRQRGFVRLTLQSGATLFEATLAQDEEADPPEYPLEAGLELTGIYSVGYDDFREIRGFSLQLRTPEDVRVYSRPKLLTVQRALILTSALGGMTLLGLGWITALRRRVRLQTEQIRAQLERQSRLEGEVHRAARLESLGELAGGIAHDFNNLLTIIIGNTGLALMDGKVTPTTGNCLREIERGAARARNLTSQLLTFAKGGDPVCTTVPLADLVRDTTELVVGATNIRCDYTIPRDVWPVHADKNQIVQAIHNLVKNAIHAMPRGGELEVSVSNEVIGADSKSGLPAGDYVNVSFKDSGEGISAEVLPRIFDPYFSTRKKGSGLGLATVYSIVKRHQGRVDVTSSPTAGTTFRVYLPAATPTARNALAQAAAALPTLWASAKPGAKVPRVLLMDDEESIRVVAGAVLEHIGTEPMVVPDGSAALGEFSVAQHNGKPFDLVILDLTIPGGMGGKEAMELIRRLDANVPVIVSSGYSSDPVMANFAAYGFSAVVSKPYDIAELAAVANRLLGRTK